MARYQLRFEQYFAAPRAKVFAYFADHRKLGRAWHARFERIRDADEGRDPNGRGSVREIRGMGLKFEETVTKFQPPSVIEYRVTRGGPVKNHLGRLAFSDADNGTQLVYTIGFDARLPFTGWLIARVLNAAWCGGVQRAVKDIAQE